MRRFVQNILVGPKLVKLVPGTSREAVSHSSLCCAFSKLGTIPSEIGLQAGFASRHKAQLFTAEVRLGLLRIGAKQQGAKPRI